MANNLKPQNPRNVFQHQSHPSNLKRPLGGVRQDKGGAKSARLRLRQPSPIKNHHRAELLNTDRDRSQNTFNTKFLAVKATTWLNPRVKAELERRAELTGLSLSKVMATGLEEWVQWKLHAQHEALLYPIIRQIIREELRAFGDRIVFFLMRIAFAAEQSRILITNVLHRILRREGVPETTFTNLVDQSNKMARRNIITKTPQIKSLIEEWNGSWKDETKEEDETGSH